MWCCQTVCRRTQHIEVCVFTEHHQAFEHRSPSLRQLPAQTQRPRCAVRCCELGRLRFRAYRLLGVVFRVGGGGGEILRHLRIRPSAVL